MWALVLIIITLLTTTVHVRGVNNHARDSSIERQTPRGMTRESHIRSIIDYWTPERMALAHSMDLLIVNSSNVLKTIAEKPRQRAAIRRSVPGTLVGGSSQSRSSTLPSAVGKFFFEMNHADYVCSASVVIADNQDMLLTAGHCVYDFDTQSWGENFIFVPRYTSGSRPLGSWVWRKVATLNGWRQYEDYDYDVAVVLVETNSNGEHIDEFTGSLGMTSNWKKHAFVNVFGYPVRINNGQTMSMCTGTTSASALNGFNGVELPCRLGGGSSGGPWIQEYDTGKRNGYQTSVVSFGFGDRPNISFAPYFGDSIWNFYQKYQNQ
ncbi:unnamed protein product [Rotaria socialis]|uniref:Peptidase S1 domain-containing protein n=1 Tax=Rotaria socialis TaxID=392032 RepID=A0A821BTB6_9BILA|nr:unnamed protein product [Rotaria socialis]CAF4598207.1 unnamed protein product [Rotaria socialis]